MFKIFIFLLAAVFEYYLQYRFYKKFYVIQNVYTIKQPKQQNNNILYIKDSRIEEEIKVYRKYAKLRHLTKLKSRFFKKIDSNMLTNALPNTAACLKNVNTLLAKGAFNVNNAIDFFTNSKLSFKFNIACKKVNYSRNNPFKLATALKDILNAERYSCVETTTPFIGNVASTYTFDFFIFNKNITFTNLACMMQCNKYIIFFFNKQLLHFFKKGRLITFSNVKHFDTEKAHTPVIGDDHAFITQKQAKTIQRVNLINYLDACVNSGLAKTLTFAEKNHMFLIDDFKELFYTRPEFKLFKPVAHLKFKHWRLLWRKRSIFFKHPIFYDFFFMGTFFSSFRQYFVEALQWSTNNETHIDVFKEFFIDSMVDFLNFTYKTAFIRRGSNNNLNFLMNLKNKQLTGNLILRTNQQNLPNMHNFYKKLNQFKIYKRGVCFTASKRLTNFTTASTIKKNRMCQFNEIVLKSNIRCQKH